MINNFHDQRVTVMGLGRFGGGVGVTRWLANQGARVTVTDRASADDLSTPLKQLADLDLNLHLGQHETRDFVDTDLVVVNPAVPERSEYLASAAGANVPITTEINLFVERCPARCIGITGSVGKSTTTAMIGHLLEHARAHPGCSNTPRFPADARIWVGGNIGRSLLDGLHQIQPTDLVVLELSSFQLARTPLVRWSPHVAVITNITPNHLDWHGDFAAYAAAKLNILRYQNPRHDITIIQNRPELLEQLQQQRGDLGGVWRYLLADDTPSAQRSGTDSDTEIGWPDLHLAVPGRHNRENAAAALTVAHALGIPDEIATDALATFAALPHRLQRVADRAGVSYYDDSKATTPEAALTALAALSEPVLIIVGGYDKGSDLAPLAREIARRTRFAACIGTTGPTLASTIQFAGGLAQFCPDLASAVQACQQHAQPGDAVLLSPACASWDQFADYRTRGHEFARLATQPPLSD